MDILAEKKAGISSPIWKLSSKHNGSNLYDSFELRAVTKQLEHAIKGSNGSLSPYSSYLKAPFCRHRLDQLYRGNATTEKRIMGSRLNGATNGRDTERGTRTFVQRLWKKVKRVILRSTA